MHALEGKVLNTKDFPQPVCVIVRFVKELFVKTLPDGDYQRVALDAGRYTVEANAQNWMPIMPLEREIYFQVTLRADKFTPDGAFVRLGDTPGDEITGWQRVDTLHIVRVLGEVQGDQVVPMELKEAA